MFFVFSYLPTASNRRKWKLERKLRDTLVQIIQSRSGPEGSLYGNDLLGLMLEACIPTEQGGKQKQLSLSMDEIIHECKTFFFAGYETTSLLLTWTVFLLSVYPEWQERLRKELLRECGKEKPSGDNLSKLKEAGKLIHMLILGFFFHFPSLKERLLSSSIYMEQLCALQCLIIIVAFQPLCIFSKVF